MGNGFWICICLIALFAIALFGVPNALGMGIVEVMSQFPLFDVIIGVASHQPAATMGFKELAVGIIEFIAIAVIIEFVEELVYEKLRKLLVNFLNKILSFIMGVLLRSVIIVILCYGKIQFGILFSAVCSVAFAAIILWGMSKIKGVAFGKFILKKIIPVSVALVDAAGLICVCEGIYRLSTGTDGTVLLIVGVIVMVVTHIIKIIINFFNR